jgi:hypothetical protein
LEGGELAMVSKMIGKKILNNMIRYKLLCIIFACIIFNPENVFANLQVKNDTTKYIIFNRAPYQGMDQSRPETINKANFEEITKDFTPQDNTNVKIGICFIFSPLRTSTEKTVAALTNFLQTAEELTVPIMVHFDFEHWWDDRPELWNWWDSSKPGFDPDNRNNVEWTYWTPDHAIKIAWRNWGRQIRVLPPPNLASPRYLEACREQMEILVPIIVKWSQRLPENKKHIFVGVKVGHESSLGVNAYYYPNGNELLDKPESADPTTGIVGKDVLSRGVQQTGYATIKTAGIRTNGDITEWDLFEAIRRYLEFLCRETAQYGIPRDKLFTHGAGWSDGELLYDAALNPYACPGWSFYAHSKDPMKEPAVIRALAKSDAPYWGAVEWLLMEGMDSNSQTQYNVASDKKAIWKSALRNSLIDKRARMVCIFNWESIRTNKDAKSAIQEVINEGIF